MNQPFLDRVANGPVVIADGGLGGILIERGVRPGGCPEALVLSQPDLLREVAADYLAAGAEVVQTNTFGGSPLKLAAYGLDDRTEEINSRAVELVREVVRGRAYVCGSCGPCGRVLEPYGDIAPDEVRAGFRRQIGALVEAGVDVLCIETMIDLAEAKLAIRAARDVSADIPVMATMTFDATPRGFYTIMGNDVPAAAAGLAGAGADVVGSNCGNGIEKMVAIAREFRQQTTEPLVIQPNAGVPKMVDGRAVYSESPEFMAQHAAELLELGVDVIGGCCGTTPAHTAALKRALRI